MLRQLSVARDRMQMLHNFTAFYAKFWSFHYQTTILLLSRIRADSRLRQFAVALHRHLFQYIYVYKIAYNAWVGSAILSRRSAIYHYAASLCMIDFRNSVSRGKQYFSWMPSPIFDRQKTNQTDIIIQIHKNLFFPPSGPIFNEDIQFRSCPNRQLDSYRLEEL